MKDINGDEISAGDTVHCWDGSKDQRDITASLRGVVNIRQYLEGEKWCVGDNELALSCAEYVEILTSL